MCADCGCGERPGEGDDLADRHDHAHDQSHPHDDHHSHVHDDRARTLTIHRRILAHNDNLAATLRDEFAAHGVFVINLVSSPGSGKTELLRRTMTALRNDLRVAAVTGDLATEHDALRLAETGAPVRQILTGTMCHLEADMIADAIADWELDDLDVLFIENVGNMVCPSGFDLGEDLRVMLVSTPEGEDKPLKYPTLTMSADVAVISKVDLAEAVECDLDLLIKNLDEVRPGIDVLLTSAKRGDGVDEWIGFLRSKIVLKAGATG